MSKTHTAPTALLAEISNTDTSSLHHVKPDEKNPLPSAEGWSFTSIKLF